MSRCLCGGGDDIAVETVCKEREGVVPQGANAVLGVEQCAALS